jgi:serine/threonine-protein kinase
MNVPEDQDPLLNTVLGGARIQRRVSAGLLANVYLGHYERLNVPVAVKVLSPKATSQGMNKERFVREGRALAQLSHPNIIKIYNVGHDNGRYFIVMDWIQDGMNLRQLAQSRPLTPVQSLKVARRLAEALDYIHQKQLIHRDIKPANVCLRKGGVPVLMDFSLIKDQQSDVQLTAPGTIMGTVNFMPPEQAQPGGPFGNVGPWSDVYSITGTLYWLLTGRPPFKGRTPMETIIKLIREPHVAPSQVNPTVPPEVDALVARGLAKKSEERFQSSREFMAAVDQVLQVAAEALARGTPPPLAEDDSGPSPAAAPAGAPPQGSAMMPKGWGAQQMAQAPAPAPPAPAAPAAAPTGSVAGRNWGPGAAAPAAASARAASSGVQPAIAASNAGSGMSRPDALRQTARLRGSSAEGRLPVPNPTPAPPPAADSQQQQQWVPTNGLDVAPDNEPTLRLKGGVQNAAQRPNPVATQSPPQPMAPAGPKGDLKRSWVEDIPQAPSWTEQQKDPGASVLGMRAAQDPGSAEIPSSTEAPAAPPPKPETPRPAPRPVSERINKAPALPPRKARRSRLEVVLIVLSVLVFLACVGVGSYLYFSRSGGGS